MGAPTHCYAGRVSPRPQVYTSQVRVSRIEWITRNSLCTILKQTLLGKSIRVLSSNWPNNISTTEPQDHHISKTVEKSPLKCIPSGSQPLGAQKPALWSCPDGTRSKGRGAKAVRSDCPSLPGGLFKGYEWVVSV